MFASYPPMLVNAFDNKYYNHSLAKEFYNACGISDRETNIHMCPSFYT